MALSIPAFVTDAGEPLATRSVWRGFARRKTAMVGALLAAVVLAGALLAPMLAPADPLAMSARRFAAPSASAWLGSDQFGRDLLSRLLYGSRVSLVVAFLAVAAAVAVGATVGVIAGYFGRVLDHVLMRLVDVLMAFPTLLLALVVVAMLGSGVSKLILAIAIAYVPTFARVVRAAALSMKNQDFVQAARALGAADARVIARHVFPNLLAPIIVQATFNLSTAIMIEAALSFLGLGVQPPAPSWGSMLSEGRNFMELDPWLAVAPGAAITVAVLGFNLLGDGLRDALDPRFVTDR